MAERLKRFAREDKARREAARADAAHVLESMPLREMLDKPEATVKALREMVERRLAKGIRKAFVAGKAAACEVIAAIPDPKTGRASKPRTPTEELNTVERRVLVGGLGVPQLRMQAENAAFVARLQASVEGQLKAGRSRQNVFATLRRDWELRGRLTGTFQREVEGYAAALIGAADGAGQECGYHGVGQAVKAANRA